MKHKPNDDRLFYKEARSLLLNKYNVHIIHSSSDDYYDRNYDNLFLYRTHVFNRSIVLDRFIFLLNSFLIAIGLNSDVYISNEPETFLLLIFIKMFTGKKIVYDIWEYYPDVMYMAKGFYKLFLFINLNVFEKYLLGLYDGLIFADSDILNLYEKYNLRKCILYNYPNLDYINDNVVKYDEFTMVYVGGLSENRGIMNILKVIKKLMLKTSSFRVIIIGNFKSAMFKDECMSFIRQNNLANHVQFLGYLPHNSIYDILGSSHLGFVLFNIIPKFEKNIPTKQFEYMASKIPTIGSDLGPISRYVQKSKSGVVISPYDIEGIVKSIETIMNDPELQKELGENGYKYIKNKWNWKKQEEKMLLFYEDILNE